MSNSTPTSFDFRQYDENLIAGVCAVLLGLGYKGLMKHEILSVTGGKKIVETFVAVVVASIVGKELTVKLKKDSYLK